MRGVHVIFLLIIFIFNVLGQEQPRFLLPIKGQILLSGNFGELRPNHFHTGVDIKTGGKVGKRLYSVAEGYVSRIKIQELGYGKTVYITHPNGFTSVYAHISRYNKELDVYSKSIQYKEQSYEIDALLPQGLIEFNKGEFIAYSGNSGNSFGPHLHYELRKTESEQPVNPLRFIDVLDTRKPKILHLYSYNLNNKSSVDSYTTINYYDIKSRINIDTINVWEKTGFGIEVYDYMNNVRNKFAPYRLKLFKNGKLVYEFEANNFNFAQKRYVNSHIDFVTYKKRNKKVHKLFIEPNNHFSLYKKHTNRGIINIDKNKTAKIKIVVEDFKGNINELNFIVKCVAIDRQVVCKKKGRKLSYKKENTLVYDNVKVVIPQNALYDNIEFEYSKSSQIKRNSFSVDYTIHDKYTPLHKDICIYIKDPKIKLSKDKIIIVKYNNWGKLSALETNYQNGYFKASSSSFGEFALYSDLQKPIIRPLNIYQDAKFIKDKSIRFKITDNLSGIKSYNGYIDGKWVLFEYDKKNRILTYYFDKKVPMLKKSYQLKIVVIDNCNNKAEYLVDFFH